MNNFRSVIPKKQTKSMKRIRGNEKRFQSNPRRRDDAGLFKEKREMEALNKVYYNNFFKDSKSHTSAKPRKTSDNSSIHKALADTSANGPYNHPGKPATGYKHYRRKSCFDSSSRLL